MWSNPDSRTRSNGWLYSLTALLPFLTAAAIALSIFLSDAISRDVCWSGECWSTFAVVYDIPIKLTAAGLVVLGALSGLQRLRISEKQMILHDYQFFRADFFETLAPWVGSGYTVLIDLPRNAILKSLYPNAQSGTYDLAPTAEEVFSTVLPEAFHTLREMTVDDPARYRATSYMPIMYDAFQLLKEDLPWDFKLNFGATGPLLAGERGTTFCGAAKDMLAIASAVNEFEGWRFFDNRQRQQWRIGVDRLCESVEHANVLHGFFQHGAVRMWRNDLMHDDLAAADGFDPITLLGIDNEAVRSYLYEAMAETWGVNLSKAAKEKLAAQLGVKYPYPPLE